MYFSSTFFGAMYLSLEVDSLFLYILMVAVPGVSFVKYEMDVVGDEIDSLHPVNNKGIKVNKEINLLLIFYIENKLLSF